MKKSELQKIIREEISTVINESPDEWYAENGRSINWRDGDPVVFGYFDDVMYTSLEPNEHWQKRKEPWTHSSLGDWIEDSIYEGDIPEPAGWQANTQPITRDAFTYPGRFWLDKLVISFWEYPKNAKELDKTIDDINKKIGPNYKIDDDWEIDLGLSDFRSSKLAQIGSYKSSKEAKPADKGQAHIAFGKHGNVPAGVGSKFKYKNQQPGETVAQMRARLKTSENKSDTMKKSELQEIIREEISKVLNKNQQNQLISKFQKWVGKDKYPTTTDITYYSKKHNLTTDQTAILKKTFPPDEFTIKSTGPTPDWL